MNKIVFISIKNLITFFCLLLSAHVSAQFDKPKPFNDTLIPVHDPVIIRQDSTYYIFCTGQGITVFSSEDMKHWKQEKLCLTKHRTGL